MAPVDLEGETLGERHRHYNKLVQEAIKTTSRPDKINPDDADIENLMKIDVASHNRDLEYTMDVLRSNDMLYVSRVLRNGAWMLEQQYAHVFNADYLHAELLPTMTTRAGNKLLLYVRLHMKDQQRADQFYRHFEDKNVRHAFKWLPYCSLSLATEAVEKYHAEIQDAIIKRLCERSINFLKELVKNNSHNQFTIMKSTTFLLKTDIENYLDIIELQELRWYGFRFRPRATKLIMKKCPNRILNNFEKYVDLVDINTVAGHIKPEDMKEFLVKHISNKNYKRKFNFDTLQYFIRRIPEKGRFEFIKKVFIDKEEPEVACAYEAMCYMSASAPIRRSMRHKSWHSSSENIYNWYRYASFETAFHDLKKLIRTESSPVERNAILSVLLICAGRKPQHIHVLLKFYQENHINEPFRFKIHFINQVVSKTNTHRYDQNTWAILNNIFHSLEVYIESNKDVSSCVQSIIVYQIVHDENIPDIIEKKFTFATLKSLRNKLNSEESKKVVGFLYRYLEKKLQVQNLSNKNEFREAIHITEQLRDLLLDWGELLSNYPLVQTKPKDLIKVMTELGWTKEFSSLYEKKWWQRQLFAQSLMMCPCEETLLNVLKHQPTLLEQHEGTVQELRKDDNITLWRLLFKLRVYWPLSRAREWITAYRSQLTINGGNRALVRGLCALLPPSDLLALLKQYVPQNTKIDWATEDEIMLSLRKNFAQNMHRARPPPPLELALQYARGDYLQFVISALRELAYNLNVQAVRDVLPSLLDTPVSLQKHGLRIAFAKLPMPELKPMFTGIWNTTKNSTVRAILFNQTFALLCREKQPQLIQELWELVSSFIDHLSTEENKEIYATFQRIGDVPPEVRGQFCMKGFKFLKTLPAKASCDDIINEVINHTREIMEKLDYDFVINDLMPCIIENLATNSLVSCLDIISASILGVPDEQSQGLRYKTILVPVLQKSFRQWDKPYYENILTSVFISKLLKNICSDVMAYVLEKDMIIPVKLFQDIQKELEMNLPIERNYVLLRLWKLITCFVKTMDAQKGELAKAKEESKEQESRRERAECRGPTYGCTTNWDKELIKLCPEFSKRCLSFLTEDVNCYFSSVYLLFGKALLEMTNSMYLSYAVILEIQKNMLCEEFIPSYLVVINNFMKPADLPEEDQENGKEIQKMLTSHPSLEVKMHFVLYKQIRE